MCRAEASGGEADVVAESRQCPLAPYSGIALAAQGVRGYHFRLLAALDQYGPTSQADLGRHTGIDRSDVVATLNDLVATGLALRRPDPADRRRNVITLTKRGADMLERLDSVLDDVQKAVLAPLTPSERKTLVRLLAKLT